MKWFAMALALTFGGIACEDDAEPEETLEEAADETGEAAEEAADETEEAVEDLTDEDEDEDEDAVDDTGAE